MIPIIIYLSGSMLFGAVSCLFGRKLYFPVLMLTVFSAVVTISLSSFDLTLTTGVITAIIGIIAALVSRFFYKLGVFLLGIVLGGCLSLLIISVLPPAAAQFGWIAALLLTAAAGIYAVKWCDFFIIASTSFNGGFMLAVPIYYLFTEFHKLHNAAYADDMLPTVTDLNQYLSNQFLEENAAPVLLLTLVIALGGFSFQIITNRKRKEE